MTLNFDEINQAFKEHLEKVTPDEFEKNLRDACPELFNSFDLEKSEVEDGNGIEDSLSNTAHKEISEAFQEHLKKASSEEFFENLAESSPELLSDLFSGEDLLTIPMNPPRTKVEQSEDSISIYKS
jgi:hypothetical protein